MLLTIDFKILKKDLLVYLIIDGMPDYLDGCKKNCAQGEERSSGLFAACAFSQLQGGQKTQRVFLFPLRLGNNIINSKVLKIDCSA
ncbi:hypothetical protein D7Z94_21640 [Ulvibacterium marinum]|uniref:Uncharacterized protein n=1 Tax=Ulvibacterium marinum TaxID=2419782 RepID=A0A3B0BWR2_9FLAO|nr:hypothetical protein D7Z94_21640 [Ulvibacterium marinum]